MKKWLMVPIVVGALALPVAPVSAQTTRMLPDGCELTEMVNDGETYSAMLVCDASVAAQNVNKPAASPTSPSSGGSPLGIVGTLLATLTGLLRGFNLPLLGG